MVKFSYYVFNNKLTQPYQWSKGVHDRLHTIIIKATEDNNFGWGEIAPPPGQKIEAREVSKVINKLNNLSSADFIKAIDCWEFNLRIRCGIVNAYFSLKASQKEFSLSNYFADKILTPSNKVPINGLCIARNPEEASLMAIDCQSLGINTIKVKVTGDDSFSLDILDAIVDVFPNVSLRLDPNESWFSDNPQEVSKRCLKYLRYPIEYIEEPVPCSISFLLYLQKLKETFPLPLALDHWGNTVEDAKQFLDRNIPNVMIIKPQVVGGIDRVLSIVKLCDSYNIPAIVTASLESLIGITTTIHCAALLPHNLPNGLYLWNLIENQPTLWRPNISNGSILNVQSIPTIFDI